MLAAASTLELPRHAGQRVTTFDAYYQAHREAVYKLCLRYGGARLGWAEDVTHDVFVKLIEHLPRLDVEEDVGGWLYRVATNLCISRLRREQSMLGRLQRAFRGVPEEEPSAELLFERKEEAVAAMAALRALPANEKIVLCMKLLDGKQQKEIAETLSMSEGYVSKLLARARTKLAASGWETDDVHA